MPFTNRLFLFLPLLLLASCGMIPTLPNTGSANPKSSSGPTAATLTCGCSNTAIGAVTPTSGLVAAGPAGPGQASTHSGPDAYQGQWTTYTNTAFGFSFAYPAVYASKDYPACAARDLGAVTAGALFTAALGARTTLTLYQTGQTLPAVAAAFQSDPKHKDFQFDAPQERTVGGVPALSLGYRSGGTNRYAESTFFIKDGTLYQVDTSTPSACDIPALNLREMDAYSHMLETFRFGK